MTEKEKVIAILKLLGLGIEYKSSLYYDEILVYDLSFNYLGSIVFQNDELVIDWL